MAGEQASMVLKHIRSLAAAGIGSSVADDELLERFVRQRDESAFAALVHRHGPIVHSVCRRVLNHEQDAEDACQAVFLILARRAASVRKRASLGSWLHGVAFRTAANLQREIRRRQAREKAIANVPRTDAGEMSWRELRAVLDEELQRMPEKFQSPLILCYLEGKTRDEAARDLGWSVGALRGRIERGRELLKRRLQRRGLDLSAGLLGTLATGNALKAAMPASLVSRIVNAGTLMVRGAGLRPTVPARVIALTEGMVKAMFLTKVKIAAALVLVGGIVVLATGLFSGSLSAQTDDPGQSSQAVVAQPRIETAESDTDAVDPKQAARDQIHSRDNLKNLALAMHNYAAAHRHFPAPAIYSGEGPLPFAGAQAPSGAGVGGSSTLSGQEPAGMPRGIGGSGAGPQAKSMRNGLEQKLDAMMISARFERQSLRRAVDELQILTGIPIVIDQDALKKARMDGNNVSITLSARDSVRAVLRMIVKQAHLTFDVKDRVVLITTVRQPGIGLGGDTGIAAGAGPAPARPPAPLSRKPLLSWRVALLPFLGEEELYKQFRLNEPWDSPHNIKLLPKMPKIFAPPGLKTREPYTTFYQVFVGPRAAFEKLQVTRISNFLDGTSNTLFIAEAAHAVPWTKPVDLSFDPNEPLPELGGIFPGIFNAALADGSVHAFSTKGDPETLRKAIMRDDGFPIDMNRIKVALGRFQGNARERNERLKEELSREMEQLRQLRQAKEDLQSQSQVQRAQAEALEKENMQLEELLRRARAEARRLREEIRGLEQDHVKGNRIKKPG
jgi:RNA polymerase sigma factor (sigma-70 family)